VDNRREKIMADETPISSISSMTAGMPGISAWGQSPGGVDFKPANISDLIKDAMREATTRVGKIDPAQMQLMGHALQAAGGVYGNNITADNQKAINDLGQQRVDLSKKNELNLNSLMAKAPDTGALIPTISAPGPTGNPGTSPISPSLAKIGSQPWLTNKHSILDAYLAGGK